jgi:multiple sugar transport system ATP-binding protein
MKIRFENLGKRFKGRGGGIEALKRLDLAVNDGEFFILLGPSGCGKSTLLNLAAGLEKPTMGRILFDDQVVADPEKSIFVPPRQRNVAMVFQNYALYPHMTVFDNIAFPLRVARMDKPEIEAAVTRTAALLKIEELMQRKPAELSGGQRQRVAICRALVRRPNVFLLDEPLSNLDAQLRTSTRAELKELQNELGITTLYVTHDQTEAMTLGSRIGLLRSGELVQVGSPEELYHAPACPFAARFIGAPPMNLIKARKKGERAIEIEGTEFVFPEERSGDLRKIDNSEILVGIRPEKILIKAGRPDRATGTRAEDGRRITISGKISTVEPMGRETLYHVGIDACQVLVLSDPIDAQRGDALQLSFHVRDTHLFDPAVS